MDYDIVGGLKAMLGMVSKGACVTMFDDAFRLDVLGLSTCGTDEISLINHSGAQRGSVECPNC